MTRIAFCAIVLSTSSIVFGQGAAMPPSFEVASVKPSTPGMDGGGITPGPNGLTARNATLLFCIRVAYNVQDYQVSGPAWLNSEQYDISAKTAAPVDQDQLRLMLQGLLADRFGLVLRHEMKPIEVYTLVVGNNGARVHESSGDGGGTTADMGHLAFKSASMSVLARRLSQQLHRPVLDLTGLKGVYDFTLDWQQDDSVPGVSLFTAVQEQLGLRLEVKKTPIEVLVVDHAEKIPVAN